jgi:hypothetical protein
MSSKNSVSIVGLFRLTPHRILHFLAFGVLSLCLSLTVGRSYQRLLILGLVVVLGMLIETVEFLGSANRFEFADVRDDALAAFAGCMLAEAYSRRRVADQAGNRF